LNYSAVPGLGALANGIAAPICDATTATCFFDLTLKANVAATHVVVDIIGYFGPAIVDDSGRVGPQGPPGAHTSHAHPCAVHGPADGLLRHL
jgi:hypothetical protein